LLRLALAQHLQPAVRVVLPQPALAQQRMQGERAVTVLLVGVAVAVPLVQQARVTLVVLKSDLLLTTRAAVALAVEAAAQGVLTPQ